MGVNKSLVKKETFILSYTNGDKYDGEVLNGVREGYGTYFYHNGDKYEGWWQNNKKHGMGTLYYRDGNLYIGQWKFSEKEGMGTLYFRNGEKYYGEFKNGKKNGKGLLLASDGNKFIGNFKDNKKNGLGVIYFNNKKTAKEEWNYGILKESKIVKNIENESNIKLKHGRDEDVNNKYIDASFDNYLEDQIKFHQLNSSNNVSSKIFTLELTQYFKAKIPNNYFDAMQILILTSDLIYENPHIPEWSEEEILHWIRRLGLDQYEKNFSENQINGYKFLKLNIMELKENYHITELKDIKFILKSIDFMRIFIKLKLDYQEYFEDQRDKEKENEGVVMRIRASTNNIIANPLRERKLCKEKDNFREFPTPHSSNIKSLLTNTNTRDNQCHVESHVAEEVSSQSKLDDDIVENQEYVLTKMAISKIKYKLIYY